MAIVGMLHEDEFLLLKNHVAIPKFFAYTVQFQLRDIFWFGGGGFIVICAKDMVIIKPKTA